MCYVLLSFILRIFSLYSVSGGLFSSVKWAVSTASIGFVNG